MSSQGRWSEEITTWRREITTSAWQVRAPDTFRRVWVEDKPPCFKPSLFKRVFTSIKPLKNADLEQEEAAATKAIGRESSPSLLQPHFPTSPWAAHSHLPLSQERGKYFPTHIRAQAQTPFLQHAGLKSCLWCFSNTPRSSNKLSRKRHRPRGTDPSTSRHVCWRCSLGPVSYDLYNCFRDRIIGYFIKTAFSPKTRL